MDKLNLQQATIAAKKAIKESLNERYVAVDSNGEVWLYKTKPTIKEGSNHEYYWVQRSHGDIDQIAKIKPLNNPEDAKHLIFKL